MSDESDDGLTLYPPWKEAVEQFLRAGFAPDTVIPDAWFYDVFGIPEWRPDMTAKEGETVKLQFLGQFKRLQECLLTEYQIDLVRVTGVGYRYMLPREQSQSANKDLMREVIKAYKRAMTRLANVNRNMLTPGEQQENDDEKARASMMFQMTRQAAKRRPQLAE